METGELLERHAIDIALERDDLAQRIPITHPAPVIKFGAPAIIEAHLCILTEHAQQKLVAKKLQMIAANDVAIQDSGFNSEYNALHVFWPGGNKQFEKASKPQIARQLIALIAQHYSQNQTQKKIHEKNSTQDS